MAGQEESVDFVFGGEKVRVPVLSLLAIERCWPNIIGLGSSTDAISRMRHCVNIAATSLVVGDPDVPMNKLDEATQAKRWARVNRAI